MAGEILSRITNETSKRERWAVSCFRTTRDYYMLNIPPCQFENSLRRHNHVGLVQALLLALAKAGKLAPAEEASKKLMKERIEQRKARGEDMDED